MFMISLLSKVLIETFYNKTLLIEFTYQNHNIKRLELSKDLSNNGLNETKQSKETLSSDRTKLKILFKEINMFASKEGQSIPQVTF